MALTFANKVTICRILAVPFFIIALLYYSPEHDSTRLIALGIFLFAVISDVIDGYIARTRNQKTQAGAILDPLADKLLLISAFICLNHIGSQFSSFHLPVWLIVAVISRDVILLIGSTLIYMLHATLPEEATRWGKLSTFFQVLTVISVLVLWPIPLLWGVCLIFTAISGVDYIRRGIKIMNLPAGKATSVKGG
jgi:CDP-diacylglycerol--glycerol-3-phosphate 3-phosphatidyltransferase